MKSNSYERYKRLIDSSQVYDVDTDISPISRANLLSKKLKNEILLKRRFTTYFLFQDKGSIQQISQA